MVRGLAWRAARMLALAAAVPTPRGHVSAGRGGGGVSQSAWSLSMTRQVSLNHGIVTVTGRAPGWPVAPPALAT